MKTALMLCAVFLTGGNLFAQDKVDVGEYIKLMNNLLEKRSYEKQGENEWDARITSVYGEVTVKPEGGDDWYKAARDMPLSADDIVKTGAESGATLAFDDSGIIRVESNTEMKIGAISKKNSWFNLARGAIVSKISFLANSAFGWKVKTPVAVAAIRGTEFAVEHNDFTDDSVVAVFDEGKVEVENVPGEEGEIQKLMLDKNTELKIGPDIKRLKKRRLFRMARHKARLLEIRKKIKTLRKNWKPISREKRLERRRELLKKNIIRKTIEERKRKLKKNLRDKRKLRKNLRDKQKPSRGR